MTLNAGVCVECVDFEGIGVVCVCLFTPAEWKGDRLIICLSELTLVSVPECVCGESLTPKLPHLGQEFKDDSFCSRWAAERCRTSPGPSPSSQLQDISQGCRPQPALLTCSSELPSKPSILPPSLPYSQVTESRELFAQAVSMLHGAFKCALHSCWALFACLSPQQQ